MTTQTPQPRRVLVAFAYDDKKGRERHDRVWIDGLPDLRTLQEVLAAETLIAQQKGLASIRILSWRGLEG